MEQGVQSEDGCVSSEQLHHLSLLAALRGGLLCCLDARPEAGGKGCNDKDRVRERERNVPQIMYTVSNFRLSTLRCTHSASERQAVGIQQSCSYCMCLADVLCCYSWLLLMYKHCYAKSHAFPPCHLTMLVSVPTCVCSLCQNHRLPTPRLSRWSANERTRTRQHPSIWTQKQQ